MPNPKKTPEQEAFDAHWELTVKGSVHPNDWAAHKVHDVTPEAPEAPEPKVEAVKPEAVKPEPPKPDVRPVTPPSKEA